MDDARISKRPDVRAGVLRRWYCRRCGYGTMQHVDPSYERPWCEGAVVTAMGVACEPHPPTYMVPLDLDHREGEALRPS